MIYVLQDVKKIISSVPIPYISVNCSVYMFRVVTSPIIKTNITVITASGIGQTAFATFRCHGAVGTAVAVPTAPQQRKVAKAV